VYPASHIAPVLNGTKSLASKQCRPLVRLYVQASSEVDLVQLASYFYSEVKQACALHNAHFVVTFAFCVRRPHRGQKSCKSFSFTQSGERVEVEDTP
jgi:hypothetical protein